MGLLSALAWFTDTMAEHAPLSYFAAATGGAIAFQGFAWLRSGWHEHVANRRRIEALSAPKGQINPRLSLFERQRIYISDLMPPLGAHIVGKTFRECDIIGPANIIMHGYGTIAHCGGGEIDGVIVRNPVQIGNVTVFENCVFDHCDFYKVTFLVPKDDEKVIKPLTEAGINWITEEAAHA